MPRRNDPERIRHAKLTDSAAAVRDEVIRADPTTIDAQREALPRLWERIDFRTELAVGG